MEMAKRLADCHSNRLMYGKTGKCKSCYMHSYYVLNRSRISSVTKRDSAIYHKNYNHWKLNNPESYKKTVKSNRLQRYGLDESSFEDLYNLQGKCCGICCTPMNIDDPKLHIDHDHNLGLKYVRGLLCNSCNLLVAAFNDKDWFNLARKYIKNYNQAMR
jgi:hypothetical protein